ncbi:MAG: MMPL family transporter [Gammaproteobacteria bacterium]|nr:MMPL family transporter [Gammaproteobacteria bacterium]
MIRVRAVGAALLLLAVVAMLAAWFSEHAPAIKVQTNLLALLPNTGRSPAVERAASKLEDQWTRRLVFLIGHASPATAQQNARKFAQALTTNNDIVGDVHYQFPTPDLAMLREAYRPYRFQLLTEADRGIAGDPRQFVQQRLQQRLYDPFRAGFGTPLQQDPLGLFDGYLASLPLLRANSTLEFTDGWLLAHDSDRTFVVLSAAINASPHDSAAQQRLQVVFNGAYGALDRDVTVLRTGAAFYAIAARESAERELHLIGIGSLVGIALMLYLVFRSFRPILFGLLSVAIGIGAAIVVTVLVFGEVHLITLVFGASLLGEAVDYAIQYYAARLDAGPSWDARRGLRAVLPGISIAVITSVLGYGALALAPFPGLRQIALFSIVGLVTAYVVVVLLLPWVTRAPARRRPQALLQAAERTLAGVERYASARVRWLVIIAIVAISLPGWWQLTSDDNVRLLINPPKQLADEEVAVRRLTGLDQGGQFFLVEGRDPQQLLEREEALTPRLRELEGRGLLTQHQAVSDFVPSRKHQQQNYVWYGAQVFAPTAELTRVLATQGFRADVAQRYGADYRQSATQRLEPAAWLAWPGTVPWRHLWLGEDVDGYASVVTLSGFKSVAVLEPAAQDLPGVTLVNKAGDVSKLFRKYRELGSGALAIAILLIFAVLIWRYRLRAAAHTLLPTLSALVATVAYCGYRHTPLTLFNIMALLLVLGVGVNYTIFLREGIGRRGAVLLGVLLSAATTLLSFGLLGWSSTPALSQFGSTLFVGIVVTVLLAPLLGISVRQESR